MNYFFGKVSHALMGAGVAIILVAMLLWAQGPLEVSSIRIGNAGEYITVVFRDTVTWDPAGVATITAVENATTFVATGAIVGDTVIVTPSAAWGTGVAQGECRITAAGLGSCVFVNPTIATVDPPAQSVNILVIRGRW